MTSDSNDPRDADIDQLLALAGPREAVPAERLERMRAAVHEAWAGEAAGKSSRSRKLFIWTVVAVATAAAIVIVVVRTKPDAGAAKPAPAALTAESVHITTGPGQRKFLRLSNGGELRVDASSAVTLNEHGEILISKGAVYLDSRGRQLPAVMTPAGKITDTGTRFEVRLVGASTRVRVRDGKVRLAQANTVSDVTAGEELLAGEDGSTSRRRADPFGAEWAWVTRAAPRFELEGQTLGTFLDWIEQEGAWKVEFASPSLERRARSTVIHGSIEKMSTTEALETILPACGLTYRVDLKKGRVIIGS
jgi:ferric-dicitrate binding protein FerR (iron transport regulator)